MSRLRYALYGALCAFCLIGVGCDYWDAVCPPYGTIEDRIRYIQDFPIKVCFEDGE